jgi:hypothetical protein
VADMKRSVAPVADDHFSEDIHPKIANVILGIGEASQIKTIGLHVLCTSNDISSSQELRPPRAAMLESKGRLRRCSDSVIVAITASTLAGVDAAAMSPIEAEAVDASNPAGKSRRGGESSSSSKEEYGPPAYQLSRNTGVPLNTTTKQGGVMCGPCTNKAITIRRHP